MKYTLYFIARPIITLFMKLFYKNTDITDLPNEVWIDVLGYDGLYSVSNMGRIRKKPKVFGNSDETV